MKDINPSEDCSDRRNVIVLIEPDESIRGQVVDELNREGYVVFASGNSEEGLSIIRQKRPDLVILDSMTLRHCDSQLLKKIKAHPETENIPVIMLDDHHRLRGLKMNKRQDQGG